MLEIIDGLLYTGKPDLRPYGFQNYSIFSGQLWGGRQPHDGLPLQVDVVNAVTPVSAMRRPIVLDIENWHLEGTPELVQTNIEKYKTVLTWAKAVANFSPIGYYSMVPIRDYWRATASPLSTTYNSWTTANSQLIELARMVDIIYPSLYTFYTDRPGWVRYATQQIKEARRYAPWKPVYAFLWPQYHDSTASAGQPIPGEYWKLQLETVAPLVDGIVIWGGWRFTWNEREDWWTETKKFLRDIPRTPRKRTRWSRNQN